MQKKLLTVAGAVVLTVAMATTAFAAFVGSAVGSGTSSATEGVTVGSASAELVAKVEATESIKDLAGVMSKSEAQLQDELFKYLDKNAAPSVGVAAVFDLTGTVPANGVVTLKIDAAYAAKGYVMYHFNGTAWEVVGHGQVGADGTVYGTFSSFSPVMVVVGNVIPTTSGGDTTTGSTTGSTTVSSPNTGVNGVEFALVFSIAAAAAVAVFAAKKIKE